MMHAEPTLDALRSAVRLACQSQNAHRIVAGRNKVLGMSRAWVMAHVERVATESLDLADYWEYRRLLELAELLDEGLVRRPVPHGLGSSDPDVREAAEDFAGRHAGPDAAPDGGGG